MPNTSSPIPDAMRPLVAIGTVLPPFVLVILAFLWYKLNSDPAVIGPVFAISFVSLVPLLLCGVARWQFKGEVLHGPGWLAPVFFYGAAVAPLATVMYSLPGIDLQTTLILPTILIVSFWNATVLYLSSALSTAYFKRRREKAKAAV